METLKKSLQESLKKLQESQALSLKESLKKSQESQESQESQALSLKESLKESLKKNEVFIGSCITLCITVGGTTGVAIYTQKAQVKAQADA
jgi:ribosomal protein L1